jgi:hypothetical protein
MLDAEAMPLTKSYSFDEDPENFLKWLKSKKSDNK